VVERSGRRSFVGALGLTALLAPLGREAWAGERETASSRGVRAVEESALGTTFELRLEHAPYPCAWGKYDDPTVYAFVPRHLRLSKGGRLDVVVHFHGHNGRAKRALETHKLREQLRESRQNAILVVPQGPVDAADGDFGKLMRPRGLSRMLEELRRNLSAASASKVLGKASLAGSKSLGRVVLSAHSGGYRAAAYCANAGGVDVREVFLFDALYGEVESFEAFVLANPTKRKLVSYHVGGRPRELSRKLAERLTARGVRVVEEKHGKRVTRAELTRGRAVFLEGLATHGTATFEEHALRDCLFGSCLVGRGSEAWFEHKHDPRSS